MIRKSEEDKSKTAVRFDKWLAMPFYPTWRRRLVLQQRRQRGREAERRHTLGVAIGEELASQEIPDTERQETEGTKTCRWDCPRGRAMDTNVVVYALHVDIGTRDALSLAARRMVLSCLEVYSLHYLGSWYFVLSLCPDARDKDNEARGRKGETRRDWRLKQTTGQQANRPRNTLLFFGSMSWYCLLVDEKAGHKHADACASFRGGAYDSISSSAKTTIDAM